MTTPVLQWVAPPDGALPEMPIPPDWILEGSPAATGRIMLQSADRLVSSGIWQCTPGSFTWEFAWDEFVQILAGEVEITELPGTTYMLKPGDLAHFPVGLKTRWRVLETVRKVFTLRTREPLSV